MLGPKGIEMTRIRWVVPVLFAVGVACASTPSSTPPKDASAEGDGDPCAGLGCPVGLPSLTVTVLGTGGALVPSPFFAEGGKQLLFQCILYDQDAGAAAGDAGDAGPAKVCAKWQLFLSVGKHAITIDAQGYVSQTLDLDLKGPTGCCGQGEQVEKTVTLVSN